MRKAERAMKTNARATDRRIDTSTRLAGGAGQFAAKQGSEALLRRSVLACLLWEDNFYEDGVGHVEHITRLIADVEPRTVFDLAVEAREKQGLRHVPLLLAREMARLESHKGLVGSLLPQIIRRADELAEFLSLYWKDGKRPLSGQVKKGLARAFDRFDEYQFAKWRGDDKAVKLRDVMFLSHPRPGQGREALYRRVAENSLATPDTWEVSLSAGKDKRATWERLINERHLGGLAFLRNLRNMEQAGVDPAVIRRGFETCNARWLLPLNYLAAAKHAPRWEREIEGLMLRELGQRPKLPGYTIFVVDISGSMGETVSGKSEFTRLHAATAMAMVAAETCERITLYATAGSDGPCIHKTALVAPRRGFALCEEIERARESLGWGGIFTRQCLEFIKGQEREPVDRIVVFSDSQDCDRRNSAPPAPFGRHNYIVDVAAHQRGIGYEGVWTAEISGWSEKFLDYVYAAEGVQVGAEDEG